MRILAVTFLALFALTAYADDYSCPKLKEKMISLQAEIKVRDESCKTYAHYAEKFAAEVEVAVAYREVHIATRELCIVKCTDPKTLKICSQALPAAPSCGVKGVAAIPVPTPSDVNAAAEANNSAVGYNQCISQGVDAHICQQQWNEPSSHGCYPGESLQIYMKCRSAGLDGMYCHDLSQRCG